MILDAQTVAAVAIPTIGVVVWLVRLEGRINKSEGRLEDMNESIKYIRDRIDRALNGHDR
jgi:hypothetical protein